MMQHLSRFLFPLTNTRVPACKRVLCLFFIGLMCSLPVTGVSAQQAAPAYSLDFSGDTLTDALDRIAALTSADLIYDPRVVGIRHIYRRVRGNTTAELLKSLLQGTQLDFIILSSGTFVIVQSSQRPPEFGSFTGQITDAATGEPLQGATVMFADASGGTVTNRSGFFSISNMMSGQHELVFSFIGYEPVRKVIEVNGNGTTRERITLNPKPLDVSPIVVSAHRSMLPASWHHEQAEARTLWSSGERHQCAVQSLSLFSGVQHGLPLSDTHIQGAQRGEHRMYLDGMPVYNPYSFGQLFSAFSPFAISRVEVEKAGFDASMGSHIAGSIGLKHALSPRQRQSALWQADPLSTNFFGSAGHTTTAGNNINMMAAFRSSVWSIFQDPTLAGTLSEWDSIDPMLYGLVATPGLKTTGMRSFSPVANTSDIFFYDVHLAGSADFGPYQRMNFSLYSGQNQVETDVLAREQFFDDGFMFSRDHYNWLNTVAQLGYDWVVSPRLDLSFQAGYSGNRMRHNYVMADNSIYAMLAGDASLSDSEIFGLYRENLGHGAAQHDSNEIRHYLGRVDAEYAINPRFSLSGGVQADFVQSSFDLSSLFYLPAVDEQQSVHLSSYLNTHFTLPGPWRFTVGSRITRLTGSSQTFLEPRAQVQYDRQQSAIGFWSLRLAGGVYRQFINQFDITNAGPSSIVPSFTIWAHDSSLPQPKAWHGSASFLSEPARGTSIRLEGWLRYQPTGYITSYDRLLTDSGHTREGFDAFAEITDMQSWGGSIRLSQQLMGNSLNLLLGYDYSRADINMQSQFGRVMPAPWNQPHSVQARAIAHLTDKWTVSGRWQYIAGRAWAFRQAYYDFLMMHNVHGIDRFNFTSPEDDRLPAFSQFDLSVIFTQNIGITQLQTRLDLVNVLNRRNVIDRGVHAHAMHADGTQELSVYDRRLPGFSPSLSVQFSF